jgi:hypothetical protein
MQLELGLSTGEKNRRREEKKDRNLNRRKQG